MDTIVPVCITVAIVAGIIADAEDASLAMRVLTAKAKARNAMKYKEWDLYDSLPDGWRFHKACGSPLTGYEFANNGKSLLKGGKLALVFVGRGENKYHPQGIIKEEQKSKPVQEIDENYCRVVNALARKKFQQRMLHDILIDLQICEIEGWCKTEYIRELRRLIGSLLRNSGREILLSKSSDQISLMLDLPCGAST
jgi:hypothetical protein